MSTENPLNKFNSYAYHHFLVLVNETAVADRLKDDTLFFRLVTGEEEVEGARVIINPLKSIQYIIQELEWTNWLAMNPEEFGSTAGSGGTFTIIEPGGMGFFNTLYDHFRALKCGTATSQWVLKTLFVGDTNVGGVGPSKVEYINYVNPLLMFVVDMDANYDVTGGEYKFTFVAAASGAGLLPGPNNGGFNQNTSVNLAGGDTTGAVTVVSALKVVEAHLNNTYTTYWNETEKTRQAQGSNTTPLPKIKYTIDIPPELNKPEYTVSAPTRTNNGAGNAAPMLTITPGEGVNRAIMMVLFKSEALMLDANRDGQKRKYYVNAAEVLNGSSADYNKEYIYHIRSQPIEPIADAASAGGGTAEEIHPAEQKAKDIGNFLEFDYLYTGKNIDVLSYEMKMASGLGFLQTLVGMSGIRDDRSQEVKAEHAVSSSNSTETGTGAHPPTFVGPPAGKAAQHATNPSAVEAYQQLLQQHSVLNVLTTIKIRGNPRLLNDITPTITSAGETKSATTTGVAAQYATQPVRCRVNVKMPKNGDPTVVEDFWYKGSYLILCVKNMFYSGEFSQELQMVAEMDGVFKNILNSSAEKKQIKDNETITALAGEPADSEARIRAFLRTIRYCEGTSAESGYGVLFNYVPFNDFSTHPAIKVVTPRYSSTAAGAYQILKGTWDSLTSGASKYASRLPDFTPSSQDIAAWCLMDRRGALQSVRNGDITTALAQLKNEWASLPTSPANQPKKSFDETMSIYNKYLTEELAGKTSLHAPRGELA